MANTEAVNDEQSRGQLQDVVSPSVDDAEWDDKKLRHAYTPANHRVALCGYDGPSTWRNEFVVPPNMCPICLAILPEYWNGLDWIKKG